MEYIRVTKENIDSEHICCAISSNRDVQVMSKKQWLADRFDDGLVFLKSAERGKCFIEYIPADKAWVPVKADGYMYIDCLWVSGSLKGHGYSNDLLDCCIADSRAKGMKGLCILSSVKKRGFLADPKFLRYKGFLQADESDCGITLMYLPFDTSAEKPCFLEHAVHPRTEEPGFVLYYTSQCPFNAKYVPLIAQIAEANGVPFRAVHLRSREEAVMTPAPQTTYALFLDGNYVTNEVQSEKKFEAMLKR